MNAIKLKLGGQAITFTKSKRTVGVRSRSTGGLEAAVASATPALASGEVVGGFQLFSSGEAEMEQTLDMMRNLPAVEAGTHVFHTSDDAVPFVPTGDIYVKWAEGSTATERQALVDRFHLEVKEVRGEQTAILAVTRNSPNPLKVAGELQASKAITVAEPDLATPGTLHGLVLPSDPLLERQWHLRNTGANGGSSVGLRAGADARVVDAWETAQTLGSPAITVAVIDDGFDVDHPDLSGASKQVAPWDFSRNSSQPTPNWRLDPSGRLVGDWHGTACAGVAVGNAQGVGIVGAAPACRLMPVRWGTDLHPARVEQWFRYVKDQGAAVVSCSWGALARNFPLATRISDAITDCAREGRSGLGVVICFAAGNENRDVNDPARQSVNGFACHPDVVAVAASTSRDERSDYSNFGKEIMICAPSNGARGRGIVTSDVRGSVDTPRGRMPAGYDAGDYTATFGGTSSATPLVAGICGLLLSLRPDMSADDVKGVLKQTARKIGSPNAYDTNGHSKEHGYGCVDALAAVRQVLNLNAGVSPEITIKPAWGKEGHYTTNGKAIDALREPLARFYASHRDQIERESMAADQAKSSDPTERPRHFLDADRYGPHPFAELPEDRAEAEQKFGKAVVLENGLLPWVIVERYAALRKAFSQADTAAILHHSAWLGHYVGDAHVPLHTTENHDGKLTGQKGLHSYFESTVLEFVEPGEIEPPQGGKLAKPILTLAFEWIRESHTHIEAILAADLATRRGPQRRRDKQAFAGVVKSIAVDRLEKGATRLASAWHTAWDEAGRPRLGRNG